jgi:hypothetical protein
MAEITSKPDVREVVAEELKVVGSWFDPGGPQYVKIAGLIDLLVPPLPEFVEPPARKK